MMSDINMVNSVLNTKVSELAGIGNFYSLMLGKSDIRHVKDLLWLFPKKIVNNQSIEGDLSDYVNHVVALNVTIESSVERITYKRKMTILSCKTLEGKDIRIIFFSSCKLFYKGSKICVYGTLTLQGKILCLMHPKWSPTHKESFFYVEYGVDKVPDPIINKIVLALIEKINLKDWIDEENRLANNWNSFAQCLSIIHSDSSIENREKAKERISFDEALVYEYAIYKASNELKEYDDTYAIPESEINDLIESFGFNLTLDQENAWQDIKADLMSNKKMLRILYGDVGSGKTLVAFLTLLMCYRSGKQAVMLAPTEILATQHFNLLKKLLPNENIVLLTRNTKSKKIYSKIENENCIVIGTHAILQDKVKYNSIGVLVIDEQHRFGVLQRMLIDQTLSYNVLLMTATPIPRTLKLSNIGSIPMSKILSRPQNHRDIQVKIAPESKMSKLYEKIRSLLSEGDNIFWVCPFVQKSEKKDGSDVETKYAELALEFGNVVDFIHGKMAHEKKENALNRFLNKETRILVSTTVIEVGVNIPHANTIVIENSELFGMAQLYQLMGRVGRGKDSGRCYFLYKRLTDDAKMRLEALQNCSSGIQLAEKDLYIRGFGNILGTQQSGETYFKCIDPTNDAIFCKAKDYLHKNIHKGEFVESLDNLSRIFAYLYKPWHGG